MASGQSSFAAALAHCLVFKRPFYDALFRYLNDDASVTVVSPDVVKRSCAYVIFYRRRPLHDVEQRRAQIIASVSAATAAAARAEAAAAAAAGQAHTPVSALDANNVVRVLRHKTEFWLYFSHRAGLGAENVAVVAAGTAPDVCYRGRACERARSTCRRPGACSWGSSCATTDRSVFWHYICSFCHL